MDLLRLMASFGDSAKTSDCLDQLTDKGEAERTFHADRNELIERGLVRQLRRGSYQLTDGGKFLLQLQEAANDLQQQNA
jgi:hypothetical protein